MRAPTRVALAAGGFVVLAASAFLVIRVGSRETTPITLAGIRFFSSSLGFAALAVLKPGLIRLNFQKRDLPLFLLTGATGSVIYSLALMTGQQTASAGTASLIGATIPIWASVMAVTIGRERLAARAWFGVALAFAGTLIITVDPHAFGGLETGAAYIFVAALSNAVYFVAVKRLVIRYGALTAVAGTVWFGAILFLPLIGSMEPLGAWTLSGVGSGLFLGLCATLAGASLFAYVIGKVGAARASMITYLVAPVVVMFEWIIFDASPGSDLLLGGALTLSGLFLVSPRYKRESEMAYSRQMKTRFHADQIRVRSAAPADIPALVRLARELAQFQDLGDRFAATEAGIRAGLFGRHRSAEAVVAEAAGEIVGYAIFARSFSSTRGAPKMIVEDVFVAPEQRGLGVGHALFREMALRSKSMGACLAEWSVLRDNSDALVFYDSLGARPSKEWMTCTIDDSALDELAAYGVEPDQTRRGPLPRPNPPGDTLRKPAECS